MKPKNKKLPPAPDGIKDHILVYKKKTKDGGQAIFAVRSTVKDGAISLKKLFENITQKEKQNGEHFSAKQDMVDSDLSQREANAKKPPHQRPQGRNLPQE